MESNEHLQHYFEAMENQGNVIVRDAPKLDLDLYISNYQGRTRFDRLLLIGQSSVALCIDALKAAIAEAKKGKDTDRYTDAWNCIKIAAPDEPEAKYDDGWVGLTTKNNQAETLRLEAELKGYKNNLIKESIRIGHRDLGQHFESTGDLNAAAETYVKMRPDASTQAHIQDAGRHIINILIQKGDWAGVYGHVNKVLANTTSDHQNADQPYHKVVSGVALLGSGKFYDAARSFLETGDVSGQQLNAILSPNDIATYGGLLALASMDRQELQTRVLENSSFRSYLELEPHVRKAVTMFVNGRYSSCLDILEAYRADYLLDIYLQRFVPELFSKIRSKCITQYFRPFSCVTLDTMTAAFAKPGESFEEELVSMIKSGTLNARINTIDRLLVAVAVDPRAAMQKKVLDAAKKYEKEALERIRRISLISAGLEVKGHSKPGAIGAGSLPGVGDIYLDSVSNRTQLASGEPGMLS
ncbi:26S proteasome subunit RPN7-domain-containing protein [Hypoxylon sp. FL1284]|nr:26S proteasome subunit RPN7-domain-containing protein [Hypoxylon sp. FL1284]